MSITVKAIYEQGILKLTEPIPLVDGTRVEVIVIASESKAGQKTPAQIWRRSLSCL